MRIIRPILFSGLLSLASIYGADADCLAVPTTAATWATHHCGMGGCADSIVPPPAPIGSASPLPTATTFASIVNPMAACCGVGWGEDPNGSQKLDCVEALPPVSPPPFVSFLTFYNFGATSDPITTAGVKYPNRAFVIGRDGIPLNGYYTQNGKRCSYRDPVTKANITLSDVDQMRLFDNSLTKGSPPAPLTPNTASPLIAAEVDDYCCGLVIFALERRCPLSDQIPAGGIQVAVTDGGTGTRRCTAAKEMKLDFALFDLCDPGLVKRSRFRTATSFMGEDPKNVTLSSTTPISVSSLVAQFYPLASPLPSPAPAPTPVCPASPIFFQYPWSNGRCGLMPPEPLPSPL